MVRPSVGPYLRKVAVLLPESQSAKLQGGLRPANLRWADDLCGTHRLLPTVGGTSRTHRLRDIPQSSWDRVPQLRRDIQTLQVELDRELDLLEEAGAFG